MPKNKKEEFKQTAPANHETSATAEKQTLPPHTQKPLPKKTSSRRILGFFVVLLAGATGFLGYDLYLTQTQHADFTAKLTAEYDQKYQSLEQRVNQQQKIIEQIKKTPATLSQEEYNRLADMVQQNLLSALPQSDTSDNVSREPINYTQSQDTKITKEILLASGALVVRGLADNSESFTYEAEVLQILATDNPIAADYVNIIRRYAQSGISGRTKLISDFNRIHHDLSHPQTIDIPTTDESKDWKTSFIQHIKKMVVLKKRAPHPELLTTPDDTIYTLVNNGKFVEALHLIETDPHYINLNSPALNEWKHAIRAHIDFEHAINGLIMNTIANIHLKELSLPE